MILQYKGLKYLREHKTRRIVGEQSSDESDEEGIDDENEEVSNLKHSLHITMNWPQLIIFSKRFLCILQLAN